MSPRFTVHRRVTAQSLRLRRNAAFVSALALLLGNGCGATARTVTHSPERSDPASSQDHLENVPGKPVSVDAELREVEAARGLFAKRPVQGREISGPDLSLHLQRVFHEQLPPRTLRGTEDALRLMRVVPADFEYEKQVQLLLRVGLAGLYEPRWGVMFLRTELNPVSRRYTLLHELVHALQDQYFGFEEFIGFHEGQSDRIAAASALAEGDAMVTMMEAALRPEGRSVLELSGEEILKGPPEGLSLEDPEALRELAKNPPPPFLLRSLAAPYQDGIRFAHERLRSGGRAALDAVFSAPPTSTEQILHVEKYLAREEPLPTNPPLGIQKKLVELGYQRIFAEPLGEQGLSLVLQEWNSTQKATAAAAGWGGDLAEIYATDEASVLLLSLRFDSPRDAEEAEEAYLPSLKNPEHRASTCEEGPQGVYFLKREGDSLFLLAGPLTHDSKVTPRPSAQAQWSCESVRGWNWTPGG